MVLSCFPHALAAAPFGCGVEFLKATFEFPKSTFELLSAKPGCAKVGAFQIPLESFAEVFGDPRGGGGAPPSRWGRSGLPAMLPRSIVETFKHAASSTW